MKKPDFLLAAEKAAADAAEAHKDAAARAKDAEAAMWAARRSLSDARIEADASLPQCDAVELAWRSGKLGEPARHVILRKTPTGLLITRRVGEHDGSTYKHKWYEHRSVYRQAEKGSYTSSTRELRNVPAEYLPAPPTPHP